MAWALGLVVAWLFFVSLVLAWVYRADLRRLWQEPVLTRPVLIIESDDWGAGPGEQRPGLEQIAACLAQFRDQDGKPPVMTLGVVLATADGGAISRSGFREYARTDLTAAQFQPLVAAMQAGARRGVFAIQLHGLEHYWPPALMAASRDAEPVRAWLSRSPDSWTDDLPSHLQSRWCDATALPSASLPQAEVAAAVRAEVNLFTQVFGVLPQVVVPPTFVWNDAVEQAWADAGVGVIVTPGRRFESRSSSGAPALGTVRAISNGQMSPNGPSYIVRNVYFEPTLGHRAEVVPRALAQGVRLGRPTLLETHRFNFVGDANAARGALEEMRKALRLALDQFPRLRFLSTQALAAAIAASDPSLIERRRGKRIAILLARLGEIRRLRKLANWTGVVVPAGIAYRILNRIYEQEVA